MRQEQRLSRWELVQSHPDDIRTIGFGFGLGVNLTSTTVVVVACVTVFVVVIVEGVTRHEHALLSRLAG